MKMISRSAFRKGFGYGPYSSNLRISWAEQTSSENKHVIFRLIMFSVISLFVRSINVFYALYYVLKLNVQRLRMNLYFKMYGLKQHLLYNLDEKFFCYYRWVFQFNDFVYIADNFFNTQPLKI